MWSAYIGQSIYLDSNAIIYAIEMQSPESRAARSLLDTIDRGAVRGVTSELTIAEVMVKPFAASNAKTLAAYETFFSPDSAIRPVKITRDLLTNSARISAETRIKLPDAIHVATAFFCECRYFLTHDERLGRALPQGLEWRRFSDVAP